MTALPPTQDLRQFPFRLKDFRKLSRFVHERTGIVLGDHKMNMVYSRLARRLRELGFSSFSDYCDYYASDEGSGEVEYLINALTTNLTKFYREAHHFRHLSEHVLTDLSRDGQSGRTRLRLWSAGCSTGEEPYSIAMTLAEALGSSSGCDAKILATDIDSSVVARGRAGRYPDQSLAELPKATRFRHFEPDGGHWVAKPELRSLITFKELNLLNAWPMRGPFDAIFCRNVMIYFDNPTKIRLMARFADMLAPGGWLYIGHSETILDPDSNFRLKGPTTYQKREAS